MATKIVQAPPESSSAGDDNSEFSLDANHAQLSIPLASEPLQNTTTPVTVEPSLSEGADIAPPGLMSTPRVALRINAPGWIALFFVCLSRLMQLITGARVSVRLLQCKPTSRDNSEALPNLNHTQPSMASDPLPSDTLPAARVVWLRVDEETNVTFIKARKLMTRARVTIGVDAPARVASRFTYLARFIQATTGTHVDVRHEGIDGLELLNLSGDPIADTASPA